MSVTKTHKPPNYSGGNFNPPISDTYDLGSASEEWRSLYIGDAGGVYFGLDQDALALFDNTNGKWTLQTKDASGVLTDRIRVEANTDTPDIDFVDVPIKWTAGRAVTAADYAIGRNADGTNLLQFNVPTGVSFEFSVQDSALAVLSATQVDLKSGVDLSLTAGSVRWSGGEAMVAGDYAIKRNADATNLLQFNVPTGASFEFSVQNTAEMVLSGSELDLKNNNLSNVGASGNSWASNSFSHNGDLTVTKTTGALDIAFESDSASRIYIRSDEDSNDVSADAYLVFETNNSAVQWVLGLDDDQVDRCALGYAGSLGSNDALRITAATPPVISYNTTHPTGTFDYICDRCGHHDASPFACCGNVSWHDDVMDFRAMVLRRPEAVDHMIRIGVMERTRNNAGDSELFTRLGPDWMFVGAMAFQNRQRMDSLYADLDSRLQAIGA